MALPKIIKDINDQVSAIDPNGDIMVGNLSILFGDTDKFINWRYSTSTLGGSWRIGALGSGSGDTNYFVIQSTTAATGASETWSNILRIGQNSFNIYIDGTTNSTSRTTGSVVLAGGLGVAKDIYAANFIGNLSGNAASATKATQDGNGATISSTYAKLATWNNLIHSGNEFTFVPGSYSGAVWLNYRTASGSLDGSITQYNFGDGKGGVLASITNGQFSGNAAAATKATQDGNGSVISSTYLKLSGGTLTGALTINNTLTVNSTQCSINYGVAPYCSSQANIQATTGLNICQGANETSGIQFNGDYIMMWSPGDSYTIRYFDEDSGSEIWNINSSGVFSGAAQQIYLAGATTATVYLYGSTTTSAGNKTIYTNSSIYMSGSVLHGAAWNDYAEYRNYKDSDEIPYGRVVIENGDDSLSLSTERLQLGGNICSDTFGFAIGETDNAKLPIAVSGRVLAYTNEPRDTYKPGEALCSGPNGTVSKMTREEIKEYPDAIVGYVSAVPVYEVWGSGNVKVDGRIWVKVR